jgi:hypothetical protein
VSTPEALQIRLHLARRHAAAALIVAFQLDDKSRQDLILSAVESLEEAMDPDKTELREVMEGTPDG